MKVVVKLMATLCFLLLLVAPALAGDINLSVAASLKDVVNELSDKFAKTHPGVKFLKNYGASGQLAKQIESGAPSDIFISANLEWMDYLKNKKQVDNASIGTFTYNTLVFAGMPGKASSMQDLHKLERIAIGSPKSVPAGEYAMDALKKAGLDKQLEKKLIMAKDVPDVRGTGGSGRSLRVPHRCPSVQTGEDTLHRAPESLSEGGLSHVAYCRSWEKQGCRGVFRLPSW